MCLTPSSVKDNSGKWVTIPCGICAECLEWKRYQWYIRLKKEMIFWKKSYFITYTYDDSELIYGDNEPTLYKPDLQKHIKRVRKKCGKSFKYYAIGEYGTLFKRPHYHMIIFCNIDITKTLQDDWKAGFIKIDPVTDANIKYILKYHILKTEYPEGSHPPFANISKGIGKAYALSVKKHHRKGNPEEICAKAHIYVDGKKKVFPRYIKEKIYTKQQQKLISKYNQKKAIEEKRKEVEKVEGKHYWKNKLDEIQAKNELIKLKQKKGNQL